jgi:hypothetical protein
MLMQLDQQSRYVIEMERRLLRQFQRLLQAR